MNLSVTERWAWDSGIQHQSLRILNLPDLIVILRLLSGTLKVTSSSDVSISYEVSQNFINPGDEATADNVERVLSYLFEEIPDDNEVQDIFSRLSHHNREFYKEILSELLFMWKSLSENNHIECFLYLYRTLERLSAACPLIFISKEKDFRNAHGFLSGLYEDSKNPGELKLLQRFLEKYDTEDGGFRGATLEFSLSDLSEPLVAELISQFKNTVMNEVKDVSIDETTGLLTLPYKQVGNFIVCIRNRTFHNEGSKKNFNLGKLGGVEPLFSFLVPTLLNWFAYVFVDFAKWQIGRVS